MKKILSLVCAMFMVVGLTGCSSADEGVDTPDTPTNEPAEGQVLKVAAFAGGYGEQVWKDLAAKFEETHEGVTVEVTASAKIDEILRPQLQSGEYPDVIQYNVGQPSGFTETLIKENALLDLSDVFEGTETGDKIANGFLDNTTTQPYGDGKIYLAPMFYSPCGLWYNKAKFGEGGYELPTTWDEMWALGDQLAGSETALFVYPTNGYFDAMLYAMLNQAGGNDYYAEALKYGPETWTSEAGEKVLDTINTLITKYTFKDAASNANSGNFMMNQQAVLDGTALFMPNGNWIIGEMGEAPREEGFEWGFMPLPAYEEGGKRYSYTFFEQMYVPAQAENPELAKEFIKFMYSDEAVEILLNNKKVSEDGVESPAPAIQPVKGIVDKLEGDNKIIYGIYETENTYATVGTFASTESIEGLVLADVVFNPIDELLAGSITKEEWQTKLVDAFAKFHDALPQ